MRLRQEYEKLCKFENDNLLTQGEAIGLEISKTLQGWSRINELRKPSFMVEIPKSTHPSKELNSKNESSEFVNSLLQIWNSLELPPKNHNLLEETLSNIKKYTQFYAVELLNGSIFIKTMGTIEKINSELAQISLMQESITQLEIKILQKEL